MTYNEWNLLPKQERNGITVDYTDPEGELYSAPFCFHTLEEARNCGKLCIDKSIQSRLLPNNVNEVLRTRIIS